ncbi:uncharacterized protein LOC122616320 [Drosophila teissieri]|uniref:uncharacterized protein LOC122616320 n=1 Tax=Drosophila teissieri TaxID=7243 RepID=UPI001CBA2DF6|nr:uncharacterized protein LOC122616320 [Drosophila teissieri]
MEQPNKDSIEALEAEAKILGTELALQNAGNENTRLKLEITKMAEVLEKQRMVLEKADDNRKEAKLIFSTLMKLNKNGGSDSAKPSNPLQSGAPTGDTDLVEERKLSQ